MNRFLVFGALAAVVAGCELDPPEPKAAGGEGGGGVAGNLAAGEGAAAGVVGGGSLAGRAGAGGAQGGSAGLAGAGRAGAGGTSAGSSAAGASQSGAGGTNAGGSAGAGASAGNDDAGGEAGANEQRAGSSGDGGNGARGGTNAGGTSAGSTSAGSANGGSAGTAEPMPTTVVVQDLEDAYIANDQGSTNFGNASELLIDADPVVYRTLIRSPGLGGMPSGATVVSATLELECYDEGGEVRVARVTTAWSESAVTWDTAPSFSGSYRSLGEVSEGKVRFDLTSFVQSWANGTENYGVVLYTVDTEGFGGSDYCSGESSRTECSGTGKRPALSITWQ